MNAIYNQIKNLMWMKMSKYLGARTVNPLKPQESLNNRFVAMFKQ